MPSKGHASPAAGLTRRRAPHVSKALLLITLASLAAGCTASATPTPSLSPAVTPSSLPTMSPVVPPSAAPSAPLTTPGPAVTPAPSEAVVSPTPAASSNPDLAISTVARAPANPADAQNAALSLNTFGLDLYRQLAATSSGNIVCSPASIALALAMARAGAKGTTAAQLDGALHVAGWDSLGPGLNALDQALASRNGTWTDDQQQQLAVALRIANATFAQRGLTLQPAYLDALASTFGSGLRLVDYTADPEAARQTINAWVDEQTERRIPQLLPVGVVTTQTRVALVNAIYLKAPWAVPFDPKQTVRHPFTRTDGSTVMVPMMAAVGTGTGPHYPYAAGTDWRATQIPYASPAGPGRAGELALTIIVPDDLAAFEGSLSAAELIRITSALTGYRNLDLLLPRFAAESHVELVPTLKALGVRAAFDPNRGDFTGITTQEPLYISAVVHQANITVDETGTEAAAATAVLGATAGPGDQSTPIPFHVDRPFLILLRDVPTGAILFMGRVVDPSAMG